MHCEEFVYTDAALLACAIAPVTTFALIEWRSVVFPVSEVTQSGFIDLRRNFTVLAQTPRETLGDDANGGVRHQKRLDSHFLEAGEGVASVVGAEPWECALACHRGLDGALS